MLTGLCLSALSTVTALMTRLSRVVIDRVVDRTMPVDRHTSLYLCQQLTLHVDVLVPLVDGKNLPFNRLTPCVDSWAADAFVLLSHASLFATRQTIHVQHLHSPACLKRH
jgi:hypothetical protein